MTSPENSQQSSSPLGDIPLRLKALRKELKSRDLDGFIIPRADEHQGEYVPPSAERLSWLTGFTGSAGLAVVLADRAAVFIDGRYTLQVRDEVPEDLFAYRHLIAEPATEWIGQELGKGKTIGFDPWLTTPNQATRYRRAAEQAGGTLVAVASNPVDTVWADRPNPPRGKIIPHESRYTGKSSHEKRHDIARTLKEQGQDAALLSAPESIAWLLNVRGDDLPYAPQPLSFAALHSDGRVDWFVDPGKPSEDLAQHLGPDISRYAPEQLGEVLDSMGTQRACVRLSGDADPEWIAERLRTAGASVTMGQDPCLLPKAIKNDAELNGARTAHERDGEALIRFLAWLDDAAKDGKLTELEAADHLEACRQQSPELKGLSFTTIAGAGPNGAIVHYRVTPDSNRTLEPGSLFLLDSGGQYLDGTTDVTRTIAIGTPSDEMCDNFTRVLRGHIAIATARFPSGTTGSQLDPFARRPLWEVGLDYDHGTGHGVGSYLNVHEGPHRISKAPNAIALMPGMIVSNEPGYYKTGSYGIRIENLVAVVEMDHPEGRPQPTLGFETLTQAPIDLRLVVPELMERHEITWLNDYHDWVRTQQTPQLDAKTAAWLKAATRPLNTVQ